MNRPRVLLADDHRIVAEGLRSILEPDLELVAIVDDGRQLVEAALRLRPDVIVADITMPRHNGLDAVEQLRKAGCTAKIIFLTMHKDASYAVRALQVGASGFVLKHSASEELLAAIRESLRGNTYITAAIADCVQQTQQASSSRVSNAVTNGPLLTPRQREILQLFAEGRTAKEVASLLHISTRTAENHKARIMSLLGVATSSDLVQYAVRHGIISVQ
jgi:DNA-binding NarL/FixJ family response regulator